MAFNLKKVLKALLLSTSQPLAIKEIQAAFARFHEQAVPPVKADAAKAGSGPTAADTGPGPTTEAGGESGVAASPSNPPGNATEEMGEISQDPELHAGVPSLITAAQIREAMDEIALELRAADDGLLLIEGNAGYRIVTHPRFARWVRILRQDPTPVRLSQSSVETLAVVAYRQPVTRSQIETIRGVSAEAGVNKLLERELNYIVGRADAPGRPIQYGTTDQFLEFVGIKSLDELPASDVLSSRQIDEWLKSHSSGHKPGDTDMGLPDEQLRLDEPVPAPHHEAGEPILSVEKAGGKT
ncbi:MAG: SMC-Scp complex subunit ScpB [Opitutus sp.]